MRVNYEEKTFEIFFNMEISNKLSACFPLGQALEGFLGADFVAMSSSVSLSKIITGDPFLLYYCKGATLEEIIDIKKTFLTTKSIHKLNSIYMGLINKLPPMKSNLLFQYKKPEYMLTANALEWDAWNQPYYRYDLYDGDTFQHSTLVELSEKLVNIAKVVYASPAISSINELIDSYNNKNLLNETNFTDVSNLKGHGRNTYIKSGYNSIACSEYTKVESIPVDKLNKNYNSKKFNNNCDYIIYFSSTLEESMKNTYLYEAYKSLNQNNYEYHNFKLLYAMSKINNCLLILGLRWLLLF